LYSPGRLGIGSVGDRVLFDDGKIGGHVVTLRAGEIDVLITSVAQGEPSFDPRRYEPAGHDLHIAALGPKTHSCCPSFWSVLMRWRSLFRSARLT